MINLQRSAKFLLDQGDIVNTKPNKTPGSKTSTPSAAKGGWGDGRSRNRQRSLGSLTQQIVEDLGAAIVTGKFDKHDFPIEAEICAHYDASRSIVREAVKVLNAKGLVIARPRKGTHVRPEQEWNLLDPDVLGWMLKRRFSLPLLIDFTRARMAIEPAASAEAARTSTAEQQHELSAALDRLQDAENGKDDPLEADIAFHLAILAASNNQFFQSMSPVVETALRFSIRMTNREAGRQSGRVSDHKAILDGILTSDPDAAAAASRKLLEEALDFMLAAQ